MGEIIFGILWFFIGFIVTFIVFGLICVVILGVFCLIVKFLEWLLFDHFNI